MSHTHIRRSREESHTLFVVVFCAIVMFLEIAVGYFAGSMALLANGIHMGGTLWLSASLLVPMY